SPGAARSGDPAVRGLRIRDTPVAIVGAQQGRNRNHRAGSVSPRAASLPQRLPGLWLGTGLRFTTPGLELRQRIGRDVSGLVARVPGGSLSGERLPELDVSVVQRSGPKARRPGGAP